MRVIVHSLSSFCMRGERNSGEIMTVPDQSLSIRKLLEDYTRGLPLPGAKEVYYDEDDIYPNINDMDLVDIQEFGLEVRGNLKQLSDEQFAAREFEAAAKAAQVSSSEE